MIIIVENEVAHAGIGVDVGVNGLDQLIKTNSAMEHLHNLVDSMRVNTVTITPQIKNSDEVSKFYQDVRGLKNKDVDVNVHTNTDGIDRMNNAINSTVHHTNSLRQGLTATGRVSGSSFNNINRNAEKARRSTSSLADSGKKVHGIFSGAFLGNAASQAFSKFTSGAKAAITSGFKMVQAGNEVRDAWRHIGMSNNDANAMVQQMGDISTKSDLDAKSIQNMQRSFYNFTGNAGKARELTNEMAAFGKASGESSQEFSRVSRSLPRVFESSKINLMSFNRTFGRTPTLVRAMAKADGKSVGAFKQMIAGSKVMQRKVLKNGKVTYKQITKGGKVTGQQLEQYMLKASKGSSHAWSQYTHTFSGLMAVTRGTWAKAKKTFAQPFTDNLMTAIDRATRSTGGLIKVQQTVQKLAHTLGQRVGSYVGQAIGWIAKNQRPLLKTGSALLKIIKEMATGAWKEFSSVLSLIGGHAGNSSHSLNSVANALTNISKHTGAMRTLGKVMLTTFAIAKLRKFKVALFGDSKSIGVMRKAVHALISPQETILKLQTKLQTVEKVWVAIIGPIKAFFTALKAGTGVQVAFNAAMDANPVGAVVLAITAAIGAITGLIVGLHHLYVHCVPARHAMQAIGHVGVMAFKAITWPERMVIKLLGGIIKGVWNATAGLRHKLAGAFDNVKSHASSFYHRSLSGANRLGKETGDWIAGNGRKYRRYQSSNLRAARNAHASIDRYRRNSSGKFRAYISKNGKIYRSYHKGTTRISETTYKQREALRRRYYAKYESSLKKYENNYKKYEDKRSSLSRRYGKLRAMYSQKSLQLIEKRFKGLRNTIVRYARVMFRDTQRIFKKIGVGAGKQFKGIYRSVRKYLKMSNGEAKRDFRQLYQISRRYLNGSVRKYIGELRYRYKKQRYYDRQLVKQSKATGKSMYRLPLGWINRETKDLIRNWQHQRRSYITHNHRMTHAELTHLHAMNSHLDDFGDDFRKLMDDLEDNIYSKWVKFWDKMHNATGRGINAVQSPLNSGAEHINTFVRAFGETSSPMHEMPEVSYATGTGAFRRPITQMVNATLNDGHDSPDTNNQETVLHPNGSVEFPQGQNVQETLEPGTEVLNATETKLLGQMAHFAPTVHFATGTGMFGGLFDKMTGWIQSALNGNNNGMSYSSIYNQAKGSGYHKLLHVLQKVLSHSEQVLSGFMGNAPRGFNGVLNDITKGVYGQTSTQIDSWWKALMNLTNQTLNDGGSDSPLLNFAEKFAQGKRYSYGATGQGGAYDCSSFVQAVLRHYGVNAPRTSGAQIAAFPHISRNQAHAGDLVGNGGHIGIVADNGARHYYSAFNQSEGIRMFPLTSTYWDGGPMVFARVPKLNKLNGSSQLSFKGANKGLMGFVKKQESPMFKWIEKHLTPLLDFSDISGTSGPWTHPGTQAHHIAQDVFEAAEHLGLDAKHAAAVVGNAWHESAGFQYGLKVNQFGGGGGKGLFQFTGQGSKYGWSPLGQVKSILANALGGPGSWEHSGGSPASLAHSFETTFERGRIPAFASRDAAAERAYQMFANGGGYAHGGHINAGEVATVGEQGEELFKPDNSGTIIPHSVTKRIMNQTSNKKPVTINQHNTYVVKGANDNEIINKIDHRQSMNNETLMEKLNRLGGNDDGGLLV